MKTKFLNLALKPSKLAPLVSFTVTVLHIPCFGSTKLLIASWPQYAIPSAWNVLSYLIDLKNSHPFNGQLKQTLCYEQPPDQPKHNYSVRTLHRHLLLVRTPAWLWFAITCSHVLAGLLQFNGGSMMWVENKDRRDLLALTFLSYAKSKVSILNFLKSERFL